MYHSMIDYARKLDCASTLEDGKMICQQMLTNFRFKQKNRYFEDEVNQATDLVKLQKLVWCCVLLESGDRVVKPLPR